MEKNKQITTKFDLQTIAEFSVAVEILGARSVNALVHQMVKEKIREAKGLVSDTEFAEMVEKQKEKTMQRSEMKSKERAQMIGEIMPRSNTSIPILVNKKKGE